MRWSRQGGTEDVIICNKGKLNLGINFFSIAQEEKISGTSWYLIAFSPVCF